MRNAQAVIGSTLQENFYRGEYHHQIEKNRFTDFYKLQANSITVFTLPPHERLHRTTSLVKITNPYLVTGMFKIRTVKSSSTRKHPPNSDTIP